jgi:hypothetical protein
MSMTWGLRAIGLVTVWAMLGCVCAPEPRLNAPILRGFNVYIPNQPGELEEVRSTARTGGLDLQVLHEDERWIVARVSAEPSEVKLSSPHGRAYELADQLGVDLVEPVLDVLLPWVLPALPSTEPVECDAPLSGSADPSENDRWALKLIDAAEAWTKARNDAGKAEFLEASDIVVGHLDTGYTEHPEIWKDENGVRPVNVSGGRNYLESGPPEDPLKGIPWIDHPGHGTASSSVIVSPDGCQLENACRCVNGVARGGQVAPLRVTRRVVLLLQEEFEQALWDVAEGAIEVDLLSIALGGYPTWAQYLALLNVEAEGIPVIAAAGNEVQIVVWPARFPSTIAAAAVNVKCEAWSGSSHGPAVDISAPGEKAWSAHAAWQLCWDPDYTNERSDGTTYATGHTSGATALWLAFHEKKNPTRLQDLKDLGLTTEVLRTQLAATAWQPARDPHPPDTHCTPPPAWDEAEMGPGILHAGDLLGQGLPLASNLSPPVRLGLLQLPLFSTLLPPDTRGLAAQTEGLYRQILGADPDLPLREIARYEQEILYHYTLSEAYRKELERYIRAAVSKRPGADPRALWRVPLEEPLSRELRDALARGNLL